RSCRISRTGPARGERAPLDLAPDPLARRRPRDRARGRRAPPRAARPLGRPRRARARGGGRVAASGGAPPPYDPPRGARRPALGGDWDRPRRLDRADRPPAPHPARRCAHVPALPAALPPGTPAV